MNVWIHSLGNMTHGTNAQEKLSEARYKLSSMAFKSEPASIFHIIRANHTPYTQFQLCSNGLRGTRAVNLTLCYHLLSFIAVVIFMDAVWLLKAPLCSTSNFWRSAWVCLQFLALADNVSLFQQSVWRLIYHQTDSLITFLSCLTWKWLHK